jgi:hypothetical protein
MASAGNGAIIFQWLERIGLGYSIPTFQAMGINNPHSLCTLTVEDYDAGMKCAAVRAQLDSVAKGWAGGVQGVGVFFWHFVETELGGGLACLKPPVVVPS